MEINYQTQKAFFGDLEEVLTRVCSVGELRRIHDHFFYLVKKAPLPNKKRRKTEMVEALLDLRKSPAELRRFVATLPPKAFALYAELIWTESVPYEQLRERLDFDFVSKTVERRGRYESTRYELHEELCFAALHGFRENYGFLSFRHSEDLNDYELIMPPAVRSWLKPHFPKPEGYEIRGVPEDEFRREGLRYFDGSASIVDDLSRLADFLTRSEVKTTKTGAYTKAGIRKAVALTGAAEWYPDSKEMGELGLMRHEILLDFIAGFNASIVQELADGEPDGGSFRKVVEAIAVDENMLEKWLIGHLKARNNYYQSEFDKEAADRLFDLFRLLPAGEWVRTANLKSAQFYREIDTCFFPPERYYVRLLRGNEPYTYEQDYEVKREYLQPVGLNPLVDGLAFVLAAFGLLELRYTEPRNPQYFSGKKPYLTRWDGVVAVRLTAIGAYVFGQSQELALKPSTRQQTRLHLRPDRLHAVGQDLDPVTKLALDEFLEPISPGFYRLTRAKLLKGCQTPKDVKRRIADLRKRLPVDFPENWNAFFHEIEREGKTLDRDNSLSVFSLASRPDLQNHFLRDPVLRRLSLKVEGHRVAIDEKDLPAVRTHLRKLGYLAAK